MASYNRRERSTTWVEFLLTSPTNWAEVEKVFAVIRSEIGEEARWDNAVEVIAFDDEILIRYEKERAGG